MGIAENLTGWKIILNDTVEGYYFSILKKSVSSIERVHGFCFAFLFAIPDKRIFVVF